MSTEPVVKAIALRDRNFARAVAWTQKLLSRIVADAARLVWLRKPALLGPVSQAIVLRAKSSATGNASIQKRRTHIVADAARLAASQRPVRKANALAPTDSPSAAAFASIQNLCCALWCVWQRLRSAKDLSGEPVRLPQRTSRVQRRLRRYKNDK